MFPFQTLIIFIQLGLEFGHQLIFRRCSFRGDSNHFTSNVLWLESFWCFFEVFYQLLQLFCCGNNWSCSRWIFWGEINMFISNGFWWKLSSSFFDILGTIWEANFLWFDINQFLNVFVNQLIVVFAFLFISLMHWHVCAKGGIWISCGISIWDNVLTGSGLCVCRGIHD